MSAGVAGTSRVLVPSAALERILEIARAIPDLADTVGFECRLGPAAGSVDFGLGVRRRAQIFAVPTPPPGSPPEWQRLAAFCHTWWDPSSFLQSWIPFAFLEFDADAPGMPPIPSVFISLDWPLSNPDDPDGEAERRRLSARVIQEALALLLEPATHDRLRVALDAAVHDLPDDGRVVHAGAMLGRSARAARLSVALPRHMAEAYFTRRGLPRLGGIIESIVATLADEDETLHLEVDVGETTIGQRIGVVVARHDPEGWARVLERVETRGLCTAEETRALLDWPQVSHLKFTPSRSGQLEAKAYLLLPTPG